MRSPFCAQMAEASAASAVGYGMLPPDGMLLCSGSAKLIRLIGGATDNGRHAELAAAPEPCRSRLRSSPRGAGNTARPSVAGLLRSVHSRGRGEHTSGLGRAGTVSRFIPAGVNQAPGSSSGWSS